MLFEKRKIRRLENCCLESAVVKLLLGGKLQEGTCGRLCVHVDLVLSSLLWTQVHQAHVLEVWVGSKVGSLQGLGYSTGERNRLSTEHLCKPSL